MDQPVRDRRTDTRFKWQQADITRATLRPGCAVRVVDLSAGGALVQAERPLRPGARVHLQLVTGVRAVALVARVLRCAVWALDPHEGATYRGAVQFEERCDLPWEAETLPGSRVPGRSSPGIERRGNAIPGRQSVHQDRHWKSVK